ncbi:MAG: ABC transporter substrate-binding protein [Amnibacterium sp.]
MRFKRKALALAGVAVAGAMLLAGCSGGGSKGTSSSGGTSSSSSVTNGFNAAVDKVINPSTKKGGTLKLLSTSDCDSWDPARTYYGWCLNMQRTFSRTLVNYSKVDGTKFQLAPDLATDMGTHNADFTQWTYTLKSGLKYSNGAAITPKDVKYAVERSYATDVITGGPGFYFTGIIKAPASYKGPYKSGDLPDTAIKATDTQITFYLKKPFADFNYLLALPTSAPVPYKTEGGSGFVGATYTKHPVASGPFEIASYTPQKSIIFKRNPNWSQSTDTIRKPMVDEIDLTIDSNSDDIDQQLKSGAADARMETSINPTFQAQVLTQPKLKAQADDPAGPTTRYIAIAKSVKPLDNVHCRRAVFYAFNKAASLTIAGGAAAGAIANSATPPGIPGYDPNYNPYPDGSDHTGDVAKAKEELKLCGQPNGFSVKYAYATPDVTNGKGFANVKSSLGRVGIQVTPATTSAENYYSTFIGSPTNVKNQGLGLMAAGWGADFPTLYGFYQNIVNGNAILPEGNSNYASINDPTVNQILDDTGSPVTQAKGTTLNKALMATAQFLPTRYDKTLWFRSTRMTNVTCNNALGFGAYDVVNVGVGG